MKANNNPRILMCPPEHFAVSYAINPWMDPGSWARDDRSLAATSRQEWIALHRTLRDLGAAIEIVPPAAGVPDLVFTANAAVVLDGKALLARFRHGERRREEPYFAAAFQGLRARGIINSVAEMPDGIVLEGAGDCVFDHARNLFWLGYGQRSAATAAPVVAQTFGVEVLALELADPRFYHMDTALSPLPRGEIMAVPQAFTARGLDVIRERAGPSGCIEVSPGDAAQLAANAVCVDDTLVLSGCSERLRGELAERGYRVSATPLNSFLRSGGAAFCLTLRLDRQSAVTASVDADCAVA